MSARPGTATGIGVARDRDIHIVQAAAASEASIAASTLVTIRPPGMETSARSNGAMATTTATAAKAAALARVSAAARERTSGRPESRTAVWVRLNTAVVSRRMVQFICHAIRERALRRHRRAARPSSRPLNARRGSRCGFEVVRRLYV